MKTRRKPRKQTNNNQEVWPSQPSKVTKRIKSDSD